MPRHRSLPQPSLPPPSRQSFLQSTRAWFKNSETILVARVTTLFGFLVAAGGALDWSPLLSLNFGSGFSDRQLIAIGTMVFAQGILVEAARRRRNSADPTG